MISEDDIARAAEAPPERVERQPEPQRQEREAPQPEHEPEANPEPAQQRQPVMVPVGEIQSERKRRKEIEERLAARDREAAELRGRLAALEQFSRQAQPPQQPAKPAEPVDPWTDPEGFARQTAAGVVDERFAPVMQFQQRTQQVLDYNNRLVAGQVHGAEAVKAAEEAFNTATERGEIDPLEHRRINNSPNPYAAAVEWHKRNQTLSKVGDDPDKWFASTFEERLRSDPDLQKKAFELLNGSAQAAEANGGRAQPVFAGLPSVNGAAGASARGPSSISDDDIYSAAPQKMGRR